MMSGNKRMWTNRCFVYGSLYR